MPKASKKRVKSSSTQDKKRKQRRFSTASTYMPLWVGMVGMAGSLLLGGGVFGFWISDPPLTWASYLVAAGGLGLGLSLWFAQPPEVAVSVGDSGVAVEGARQSQRLSWYQMRTIRISGEYLVLEGETTTLKFQLGANRDAAAVLLKEAAQRVPNVMDVDPQSTKSLPDPNRSLGQRQDIGDDQVAGLRCAASKKLIHLEEDARLCPRCGQVYLKEEMPSTCVSCQADLGSKALLA